MHVHPVQAMLRERHYYITLLSLALLSLLSASAARSQIALGEIQGSFPSGDSTATFHGYIVFMQMPNQAYLPVVSNVSTGNCLKAQAPLMPTYQWAQQTGAFLALNGSFFNPETEFMPGDCRQAFGPVKSNGVIIAPITKRPDGQGNPALLFAKDGTPSIRMASQTDVTAAYNVVAGQWEAGPALGSNGSLLIANNVLMGGTALPVPAEIAPRTGVGLTQSGTLILVMIEGRLPGSDGITLPYLARLLQVCGAYNAINLDGGGSSTMTYMPGPGVPMQESLVLYNLMRSSQSDDSLQLSFTQLDPRVPFSSRASDLIPPSNPHAQNHLYRPVAINFGFVVQQTER